MPSRILFDRERMLAALEAVDVATRLTSRTRRAIQEVAAERGLPQRGLNDDAAVFSPVGLTAESCHSVFAGAVLTVLAPSADWIFLMKLDAARVVDRSDMVRLWPHSGFATSRGRWGEPDSRGVGRVA